MEQKNEILETTYSDALQRWEILLLTLLTPVTYLGLCFIVLRTEYDYPHRILIDLFDSEIMPFFVISGLTIGWLIVLSFLPFGSKRLKIYLTWLTFLLFAVAITDIYIINMWQQTMA